jgi:hypothetical protein
MLLYFSFLKGSIGDADGSLQFQWFYIDMCALWGIASICFAINVFPSETNKTFSKLLLKYLFPLDTIGFSYGKKGGAHMKTSHEASR